MQLFKKVHDSFLRYNACNFYTLQELQNLLIIFSLSEIEHSVGDDRCIFLRSSASQGRSECRSRICVLSCITY